MSTGIQNFTNKADTNGNPLIEISLTVVFVTIIIVSRWFYSV